MIAYMGESPALGMKGSSEVAELDPLQDLLAATARGDRSAFRRVYQLTASRLYPIALRLLSRRDAADEVLQEAFVLVWRKAAQYRADKGRPIAWMTTIVRNCAIDRLRSEAREPRNPEPWDEAAEAKADPSVSRLPPPDHSDPGLRKCLEALQENQRQAILLAYYHGLTHEELSARMEVPLGTVKSWVRRGLLQLRECLG